MEQRVPVTVKDEICFITPTMLPATSSRIAWTCCEERVFATLGAPISRGTESLNPVPSSGESCELRYCTAGSLPTSNGWSRISHNPYLILRGPAEPAAARVFVRGVRLVDVHDHGPLEVRPRGRLLRSDAGTSHVACSG